MTKIIYGGLLKDRINLSREENKYNLINSERTLKANAIAKTKTKRREAIPIIYGDLYKKRIAEREKEDILKKRLDEMSYSVREGRRRAEQPQREGVIMPGQVANRTPPISAITKEMIDEYHEAEKLKPLIIDGEIRKYEKALYEPNLTFDEEIQSSEVLESYIKDFESNRQPLINRMTDIDNEIIRTNDNIQRIKNDINEKGFTAQKNILLRREEIKLHNLKQDYQKSENEVDIINAGIRNVKQDIEKIKKHNAEVSLRNRDEVLKYEQSLNLINKNRLNLQQQPNESEYEYYNRLREIERTKYDPVLYKQYAENEQTKTLKTHLNSLFDNTTFKEEVLSHIPPEDKFIINKHFDEIEGSFLDKFGYNNKSINPKTTANALLLLSNKYKTSATTTLQSMIKRLASQKVLKGKQAEAKRADEINQQIQGREQRILAREAKALEKQLREEYDQTQRTEARNIERNRLLEVNRGIANERAQRIEQLRNEQERIARENEAYRKSNYGSTKIQKVFRGHKGRKEAQRETARQRAELEEQEKYFSKIEKELPQHEKFFENIKELKKELVIHPQRELVNKEILKNRRLNSQKQFEKQLEEIRTARNLDWISQPPPQQQQPETQQPPQLILNFPPFEFKAQRKERKDKGTKRKAYNIRVKKPRKEGEGLRGRIHPKKRIVKVSKTQLLKNRLALITSEIKAGNDNPKLIVEMDKLYKKLYDIDNAHLHFKK
jgi:hypothetical protein